MNSSKFTLHDEVFYEIWTHNFYSECDDERQGSIKNIKGK